MTLLKKYLKKLGVENNDIKKISINLKKKTYLIFIQVEN